MQSPMPEKVVEKVNRRKKMKRRQRLMHLINLILGGQINSAKKPMSRLFNQKAPRFEYTSPSERSQYNYGYMEADEMMAGTPFVGE